MKNIVSAIMIFSALVLYGFQSTADTISVDVKSNFFDPGLVTANVGDVIKFEWKEGTHTTTSDTVPAGAQMWDAPINSTSTTFLYTIAVAGHYHYFCTIHGQMMSGVIEAANSTGISPVSTSAVQVSLGGVSANAITIHYQLASGQNTVISLYDVLGEKIQVLQNGFQHAGDYMEEYQFEGVIPPGIYLLRMESGNLQMTEKIIIR